MLGQKCKLPVLLLVCALLFTAGCSQRGDTPILPPQSELPHSPEQVPDKPTPPVRPEALYLPVMEVLCAKTQDVSGEHNDHKAELADIDGDGVAELMATYLCVDEREQRVEIWTIRNEKVALLWEQTLFINAGDPCGGICLVTKDRAAYLCIFESNINGSSGENENRMDRYDGTIRFFSVLERMGEDTSIPGALMQAHSLHYTFSGPDDRTPSEQNEPSQFLFEGHPTTEAVFNDWITAFDHPSETYLRVGRGEYIGKSFGAMVSELKNEIA